MHNMHFLELEFVSGALLFIDQSNLNGLPFFFSFQNRAKSFQKLGKKLRTSFLILSSPFLAHRCCCFRLRPLVEGCQVAVVVVEEVEQEDAGFVAIEH